MLGASELSAISQLLAPWLWEVQLSELPMPRGEIPSHKGQGSQVHAVHVM